MATTYICTLVKIYLPIPTFPLSVVLNESTLSIPY